MAIGIAAAGVVVATPGVSVANPACSIGGNYRPGQMSTYDQLAGIRGAITDPGGAQLLGSPGNEFYQEHLLAWMEELNEHPKGPCGAGNSMCWIQVGVGMGEVGANYGPCYTYAKNYTGLWQIYFEGIGAGGVANCVDEYFPNIQIRQNSSPNFTLSYDGGVGYTGQPQFEAYVIDRSGHYVFVDSGELYYPANHVLAAAEIGSGVSEACPSLTNGFPYQHFGTGYQGGYSDVSLLKVENLTSAFEVWGAHRITTVQRRTATTHIGIRQCPAPHEAHFELMARRHRHHPDGRRFKDGWPAGVRQPLT
ncbi:MAG: hypothetical protein ACR2FF_01180 [Mycobacteriales bacterium]